LYIMKTLIRLFMIVALLFLGSSVSAQESTDQKAIDKKVRQFLENKGTTWHDMNVPDSDGKVLYDLIIKNNFTRALEIGTSTGHSGIWIAWALSKTGGKLITIEINEGRHKQAVENFKKAGLETFIDARNADAHEFVAELEGPFDFVFSDADKDWYTRYLKALLPKLEDGGCFTAHNVSNRYMSGIREFLDYLESLPYMETTIDRSSRSGISISYKKHE